jgi:hypothetical protein
VAAIVEGSTLGHALPVDFWCVGRRETSICVSEGILYDRLDVEKIVWRVGRTYHLCLCSRGCVAACGILLLIYFDLSRLENLWVGCKNQHHLFLCRGGHLVCQRSKCLSSGDRVRKEADRLVHLHHHDLACSSPLHRAIQCHLYH